MKYLLTVLFFGLSGLLFAQKKNYPVELAFSSGYASMDLNWSIAGNSAGQSPNVLSEVKWNNISGPIVGMQLKINLSKRCFLAGEFAKVWVKSGIATDSDYAEDGRKGRTYQTELRSDEGALDDFSVLAGYYFMNKIRIKLAVLGGYNENRENLFLLNKSDVTPDEKSLHSTYKTSWKGPSVAVAANYMIIPKLNAHVMFTYSQVDYNATADWNLIDAFSHPVSFTHHAKGFNVKTLLGFSYQVIKRFSVTVAGTYNNAQTGSGIDRLYLESGSTQTTQFNAVERTMKSVNVGVIFRI